MSKKLKIFLPLLVLAMAGLIAFVIVKNKPEAKRQEMVVKPTLVDVVAAQISDEDIFLEAMGEVQPSMEVTVNSEVSGRIIELGSNLAPGGRVAEGELLVKIDPRDYLLALEKKRGEYQKALFDYKVEVGRSKVAQREWNLLKDDVPSGESNKELALRLPQLEAARAALKSAESGLEQAKLDIQRTEIKAPFNALIKEKNVGIGQLVNSQTKIAVLLAMDDFWVETSFPVNQLRWIKLPDAEGNGGSAAVIIHEVGQGVKIERQGRLIRLLGNLTPVGRMAQLLIEVEDPLGWKQDPGGASMPLFIGAYVKVRISGKKVANVFKVPRSIIREDDLLWIMNDRKELEFRRVNIEQRLDKFVIVNEGLEAGEKIVVSRISNPIPGMKLRLADEALSGASAYDKSEKSSRKPQRAE